MEDAKNEPPQNFEVFLGGSIAAEAELGMRNTAKGCHMLIFLDALTCYGRDTNGWGELGAS